MIRKTMNVPKRLSRMKARFLFETGGEAGCNDQFFCYARACTFRRTSGLRSQKHPASNTTTVSWVHNSQQGISQFSNKIKRYVINWVRSGQTGKYLAYVLGHFTLKFNISRKARVARAMFFPGSKLNVTWLCLVRTSYRFRHGNEYKASHEYWFLPQRTHVISEILHKLLKSWRWLESME